MSAERDSQGKLKSKRSRLRQAFGADVTEQFRKIKLVDDILARAERVLNPAAHAGNPPLTRKR
jgi:hypothetical protein